MLNITGSMKTLKGELLSAKGFAKDIIGALKDVTPDTNLTKNIGSFVHQIPEYKVITKDAESAKKLLRKVCTEEVEPQEAAQKFEKALQEIEEILSMLEPLTAHNPHKLF